MSDYFSHHTTTVYNFDSSTGKLTPELVRLPGSSNPTTPAPVYTPGTRNLPLLGKDTQGLVDEVVIRRGQAVYFVHVQGPASGSSVDVDESRRTLRQARKEVRQIERMAQELEAALLQDDSASDNYRNDPGSSGSSDDDSSDDSVFSTSSSTSSLATSISSFSSRSSASSSGSLSTADDNPSDSEERADSQLVSLATGLALERDPDPVIATMITPPSSSLSSLPPPGLVDEVQSDPSAPCKTDVSAGVGETREVALSSSYSTSHELNDAHRSEPALRAPNVVSAMKQVPRRPESGKIVLSPSIALPIMATSGPAILSTCSAASATSAPLTGTSGNSQARTTSDMRDTSVGSTSRVQDLTLLPPTVSKRKRPAQDFDDADDSGSESDRPLASVAKKRRTAESSRTPAGPTTAPVLPSRQATDELSRQRVHLRVARTRVVGRVPPRDTTALSAAKMVTSSSETRLAVMVS
ncbi:hypothetical protein C8Q76DRAFT_862236 [Earliella scabrosa]|nr:hypothetical protein C8Q76DRAFT_862236 [Earliella scabrosa]